MMSLSMRGNHVNVRGCSAPNSGFIVSMHVGKQRKGTLAWPQLKYRTKHEHLLINAKEILACSQKGERVTIAEMHRGGKLQNRTTKGKSTTAKDYTLHWNHFKLCKKNQ